MFSRGGADCEGCRAGAEKEQRCRGAEALSEVQRYAVVQNRRGCWLLQNKCKVRYSY
jgi:hypothetical protein